MRITVDKKEIEVTGKRPLIEELRALGKDIPSLCYDREARHQASCMVCMVWDVRTEQMLPSCSTLPIEGMEIDTESEEVVSLRRMSLELLLSDHRADCEAPCTVVCPAHIDVAQILLYYDRGDKARARSLLLDACQADALPCEGCKASCEKACRRRTVDEAVSIRGILKELAQDKSLPMTEAKSKAVTDKTVFSSKLGRYTDEEKAWLREEYKGASRCLHCACEGRDKCRLREHATKAGIKAPRYGVSSLQPVKVQHSIGPRLCFEPAKCIRCGLCVYNSDDGFTFLGRGFKMQVTIPEENYCNAPEELARLCPTGALFISDNDK